MATRKGLQVVEAQPVYSRYPEKPGAGRTVYRKRTPEGQGWPGAYYCGWCGIGTGTRFDFECENCGAHVLEAWVWLQDVKDAGR